MDDIKIAFIGAGNMSRALISGLIASGFSANNIWASNPSQEKLGSLVERFNIQITTDNQEAASNADIIILGVKPMQMAGVCAELSDIIAERKPLIISIAAGVNLNMLMQWLGNETAIVRAMPNIGAMVVAGATGLTANEHASDKQKDYAESIFEAVGVTGWVSEEDIDAVTALSGSGSAYVFMMMEAMEKAAETLNLSPEVAKLFTLQTTLGAAKMAMESEQDLGQLRDAVTSPNGTTERAIKVLETGNIFDLYADAIKAAWARSKELSELVK